MRNFIAILIYIHIQNQRFFLHRMIYVTQYRKKCILVQLTSQPSTYFSQPIYAQQDPSKNIRVYQHTSLYHSNIPKLLTFTNISTYPKIHQHLPFNTLSSTFLVNIQLEIKMEAYTEHNTICIK